MKEKVTTSLVQLAPGADKTQIRFLSKRHVDTLGNKGEVLGHCDDDITISFDTTGAVYFSDDDEGFTYLYPEQVNHLQWLLAHAKGLKLPVGAQSKVKLEGK